jgi:sugar (pentulose or hexulose) kinase
MRYAIAVFDIGMTNKKVAVYDDRLKALDSLSRRFEPLMVEGIETHDLKGIRAWLVETLRGFAARYPIRAISISAHGASFVCLDAPGEPCVPCVFYTHEPGPDFHQRFYALAGERSALQEATGTPDFSALINPAKGILFARERFAEEFASTADILLFPQYFGHFLTGKKGAEPTYVGCHTYLWDWRSGDWSGVADRLGVRGMLPPRIAESWKTLGTLKPEIAEATGLGGDTIVTMGIHDSNASLLPYLSGGGKGDFILNSTGTWCVAMHPGARYGFAKDEIGKVVFFNRAATLQPVKTAIFLGGLEHERWSAAIEAASGSGGALSYSPEAIARLAARADCFILPEVVPGSGQFPGSAARAEGPDGSSLLEDIRSGAATAPAFLADAPRAYAALALSLALQTMVALERVGMGPDTEIFVEGGFRKNEAYLRLLADFCSPSTVFVTSIEEASSLGAAMLAKMALDGCGLEELRDEATVEKTPVLGTGIGSLPEYRKAWQARLA